MGKQARLKKARRAARAAGLEPKLVSGTFGPFDARFDDFVPGLDDFAPGFDEPPGSEDDCENCPVCRELRAMGLSTEGDAVLTEEQAARLSSVMRAHRDDAVFSFFADDEKSRD
jgi:hypothetical protein